MSDVRPLSPKITCGYRHCGRVIQLSFDARRPREYCDHICRQRERDARRAPRRRSARGPNLNTYEQRVWLRVS